jgi:hypothetical protein
MRGGGRDLRSPPGAASFPMAPLWTTVATTPAPAAGYPLGGVDLLPVLTSRTAEFERNEAGDG